MASMIRTPGIIGKSEVGKPIEGQIYMLVGVDKVRFKRMVEPGDQLHIKAEVMTIKRGIWKFKCSATVDEKIVTTAELMCTQKTAD
jgi:3-hydroxyacyl-[acyl-carrier-protein] dehydratase